MGVACEQKCEEPGWAAVHHVMKRVLGLTFPADHLSCLLGSWPARPAFLHALLCPLLHASVRWQWTRPGDFGMASCEICKRTERENHRDSQTTDTNNTGLDSVLCAKSHYVSFLNGSTAIHDTDTLFSYHTDVVCRTRNSPHFFFRPLPALWREKSYKVCFLERKKSGLSIFLSRLTFQPFISIKFQSVSNMRLYYG